MNGFCGVLRSWSGSADTAVADASGDAVAADADASNDAIVADADANGSSASLVLLMVLLKSFFFWLFVGSC